jgi:HSP20 family protein
LEYYLNSDRKETNFKTKNIKTMSYVKMNNGYTSFDGLMKELFNEFPTAVSKVVREDVFGYPPVNITDKKDHYLVELAAPGYQKADFAIKLDNNILTVSVEEIKKSENTDEKKIRKEFTSKSFKRSFTLNEKIETEKIEALYENGILKIGLPKKENTNSAVKDISVS